MSLKETLVNGLESLLRWAYKWLSDNDEILGKVLYTLHILAMISLFIMIFVSHVIYPVIWLQIGVFLVVLLVWLQHICLRTCICSSLERRLMGTDSRLAIDIVLDVFGIPVTKHTRMGVTLLLSTFGVVFLGLELVARGVLSLREYYGFSTWA